MNNIQELKDLRLDELLRSSQFLGLFPSGVADDERLQFLFEETTRANTIVPVFKTGA